MSQSFHKLLVLLSLALLTARVQSIGIFCSWMADDYMHCFLRGKNPADDIDLNYHESGTSYLVVLVQQSKDVGTWSSINVDKLLNDHIDDDHLSYYHEIPDCGHCEKPADCISDFRPAEDGNSQARSLYNTYINCARLNSKTLQQFKACGNEPFSPYSQHNGIEGGSKMWILQAVVRKCGADETWSYLAGEGGNHRFATWPYDVGCAHKNAGQVYTVNGAPILFTKKVSVVFPNGVSIAGFPARWFDGIEYISAKYCSNFPVSKVKIPENEKNSFTILVEETQSGPGFGKKESLNWDQWTARFAFNPALVLI